MFNTDSRMVNISPPNYIGRLGTFELKAGRKYFIAADIKAEAYNDGVGIDELTLYVNDTSIKSYTSPDDTKQYPFYGIYTPTQDETAEIMVKAKPTGNTYTVAYCANLVFADIT
jgi:hypothetical protein